MKTNNMKNQKLKMIQMTNRFLKRAKLVHLKLMQDEAKGHNDPQTLSMHAKDLADTMYVCGLIKKGDYVNAYEFHRDMDTDPRDMFPNCLIDTLEKIVYSEEE
jgi:cellobiose-specific phosphotransferase system component IIA